MKLIIAGNPIDGFKLIGPFKTDAEACDHAETHNFYADHQKNWWIMVPESPEPEKPEPEKPEPTAILENVRLVMRAFPDAVPSAISTLQSIGAVNVEVQISSRSLSAIPGSNTQQFASRAIYFEGPSGMYDKAMDAGLSVEEFRPDKRWV